MNTAQNLKPGDRIVWLVGVPQVATVTASQGDGSFTVEYVDNLGRPSTYEWRGAPGREMLMAVNL